MSEPASLHFDQDGLGPLLDALDEAQLDQVPFGVIGIDDSTAVTRYNALESQHAGLTPQRVLGLPLFTVVAPCMNNFMVGQRFDEAAEGSEAMDDTIDYVLTLRMRPTKVKLRLIASPGSATRYVLVNRPT
jgi:photoactive yellow protein